MCYTLATYVIFSQDLMCLARCQHNAVIPRPREPRELAAGAAIQGYYQLFHASGVYHSFNRPGREDVTKLRTCCPDSNMRASTVLSSSCSRAVQRLATSMVHLAAPQARPCVPAVASSSAVQPCKPLCLQASLQGTRAHNRFCSTVPRSFAPEADYQVNACGGMVELAGRRACRFWVAVVRL